LQIARYISAFIALPLAVLVSACATQTSPLPTGASDAATPELACAFAGNCVNSLGTGSLAPLRYTGTSAQALATLQATLATFPEARVVRSEPLEAIFTTPIGFRDQVDFRIDAQAQRIDFRSRSLFGLFDWGKNRSRMQDIAIRFAELSRR
jgi:uncharacterized protein (DUF1499 family)